MQGSNAKGPARGAGGEATRALLRDGRPDWDAIEFDVLCARCDYNLRTLTAPRCPECGLTFDWFVALDRAQRKSAFLFEHAWRRRPVRAWLQTVAVGLLPWRFWRRVSIHDPVEVRPLYFMLISGVMMSLVVLHGAAFAAHKVAYWLMNLRVTPRGPTGMSWWEMQWQLYRLARWPLIGSGKYWYVVVGVLGATAGIVLLLMSLRQTLGRCRVRPAQMLRVVAYALPPAMALCALVFVAYAGLLQDRYFRGPLPFVPTSLPVFGRVGVQRWEELGAGQWWVFWGGLAVVGLVLSFYLTMGLRMYLRLPRPALLAVTTVVVALLFAVTVLSAGVLVTAGWSF